MSACIVLDACVFIELILDGPCALAIRGRTQGHQTIAPAHFDAEVFSALARLHRHGELSVPDVEASLESLRRAPLLREPILPLLAGSWARRHNLRVLDALYVELAAQRGLKVLTIDAGMVMAAPSLVEVIRP